MKPLLDEKFVKLRELGENIANVRKLFKDRIFSNEISEIKNIDVNKMFRTIHTRIEKFEKLSEK